MSCGLCLFDTCPVGLHSLQSPLCQQQKTTQPVGQTSLWDLQSHIASNCHTQIQTGSTCSVCRCNNGIHYPELFLVKHVSLGGQWKLKPVRIQPSPSFNYTLPLPRITSALQHRVCLISSKVGLRLVMQYKRKLCNFNDTSAELCGLVRITRAIS